MQDLIKISLRIFQEHDAMTRQALTDHVHAYVENSKSQILQIRLLDYFQLSTLSNTLFQFPEYMKQL